MSEWKMLYQGCLLLLAVTFCGVFVAEQQMNQMTQRQEIQSFRLIAATAGNYQVSFLGESYNWQGTYSLGPFFSRDQALYVGTGPYQMKIPYVYTFGWQPLYHYLAEEAVFWQHRLPELLPFVFLKR